MGSGPEVAPGLLECLRAELGAPALRFAEPPVPIAGGFDTEIFAFRLREAPPPFAGPLVLRRLGLHHDPARVLRERATQNALADLGYPAPRVVLASRDARSLGGPFLVMERLPGRPLPEAYFFGMSRLLADMQVRLHGLDPDPLLRALDREGAAAAGGGPPPVSRGVASLDGYLAQLEARVERRALEGLRPAIRWLVRLRPRHEAGPVICHGDFHPYNVLVSGDAVTGVIDWPNTIVGDPVFDVATTKAILGLVPLERTAMTTARVLGAQLARRVLVARYVTAYRRRRPLDPATLPYYEAASAMRWLVQIGESRVAAAAGPPNRLDTPAFARRLGALVARVTGVAVRLPPP